MQRQSGTEERKRRESPQAENRATPPIGSLAGADEPKGGPVLLQGNRQASHRSFHEPSRSRESPIQDKGVARN